MVGAPIIQVIQCSNLELCSNANTSNTSTQTYLAQRDTSNYENSVNKVSGIKFQIRSTTLGAVVFFCHIG